MKKIFYLLFAITFLITCKNDEQEADVLPEATQSGKNTGGAMVDGQVWIAKIEGPVPPNLGG